MVTGTFRTIKMWQLVLPFVPSSCLILQLSWKRLGITGHYNEVDFFFICPVTWESCRTDSEEMMSFLIQREEVAERA